MLHQFPWSLCDVFAKRISVRDENSDLRAKIMCVLSFLSNIFSVFSELSQKRSNHYSRN